MKLSIVVPCYNAGKYLVECLDSIRKQTYKDWECICVDDGSTDDSGRVLDHYAAIDERFLVLHAGREGVSAARNRGIAFARGDFVGFIDADDTIAEGWFQGAVDAIEKSGADLVRLETGKEDCRNCVTPEQCLQCGFVYLCFVRASVLKRIAQPFPVGMRLREDTIFLLRVLSLVMSTYQSFFLGYHYRNHGSSTVYSVQKVADFVRFVDELMAVRVKLSKRESAHAIYKSFLWWRTQRLRCEGDADRVAKDALSRAEKRGVFSYQYAPLLWVRRFWLADSYIWLRRAVNAKWLP